MTGTGANAHILIVDDDRLVLALIGRGLRDAGYRVTEANDSASALRAVEAEAPDLALLDVRMPDMSGVKLAETIAARHAVPFMFLSAYDDPATIGRATELGALGYLVKPLDVPQIIPSIEAALARAAQIRSLKDTGEQLSHALETGREINVALGILMERQRLTRQAAYELLRTSARSQRRRMQEIAASLVDALDQLNGLAPARERPRDH
ncbi:MAG TPA: response regulator [Burkholderiales bacterium]|nr:response regulator [Burkholderiales bacterium]